MPIEACDRTTGLPVAGQALGVCTCSCMCMCWACCSFYTLTPALTLVLILGLTPKVLGVLQLVNKKGGGEGAGRAFGAEDEALLAAIATHLSNALTNAVLYRDALDATRHSEAVLTLSPCSPLPRCRASRKTTPSPKPSPSPSPNPNPQQVLASRSDQL